MIALSHVLLKQWMKGIQAIKSEQEHKDLEGSLNNSFYSSVAGGQGNTRKCFERDRSIVFPVSNARAHLHMYCFLNFLL